MIVLLVALSLGYAVAVRINLTRVRGQRDMARLNLELAELAEAMKRDAS